ncbi:carbonate dehydratase [Kistimonas asteriae]|uniref:carbonate dehydratase n=1 Tax=Kistimonas asteriae TaxID=517724 RepID=UPI001BADCA99
MKVLKHLFDNNQSWSESVRDRDPEFFQRLSRQQAPRYLWIGCSDSRVPANEIVGLMPGELFVHRNVANVVVHSDLNCLSVIHYAVNVLGVEHIIVCGHYGCGGVEAAISGSRQGMIDNWLRHIQDTELKHRETLAPLSEQARIDSMCELNVIEQVVHVCQTSIVQEAWADDKKLSIHSWIYGLKDGLLRDLGMCVNGSEEMQQAYGEALERVFQPRDTTPHEAVCQHVAPAEA